MTDLVAAAQAGKATFYAQRSNGTGRRMTYLPIGTPARRSAERIVEMRTKKVSMRDIAKSMHVSIPTVRRMINNLELSLHLEDGSLTCTVAQPPSAGAS